MTSAFALPRTRSADREGLRNRARLDLNGIYAVSLAAPAGTGKARLVAQVAERLAGRLRLAVASRQPQHCASPLVSTLSIEGPSASPVAAEDLARTLASVRLAGFDVLLVDDIGEGAGRALGVHAHVALTTVHDVVGAGTRDAERYSGLDALVVHQTDRGRDVGFDETSVRWSLAAVNPNLLTFFTSCVDGSGIDAWGEWMIRRRNAHARSPGSHHGRATAPHLPAA
jgi:hydrogenase nickel incorporation protein HypB